MSDFKWKRITKQMEAGNYLVTNNLKARDSRDKMSHIWHTSFIQKSSTPHTNGKFICFTASDQLIHNLTHYVGLPW